MSILLHAFWVIILYPKASKTPLLQPREGANVHVGISIMWDFYPDVTLEVEGYLTTGMNIHRPSGPCGTWDKG